MTQVHDFSLSLICLSQAVAAEAATEANTSRPEAADQKTSNENATANR